MIIEPSTMPFSPLAFWETGSVRSSAYTQRATLAWWLRPSSVYDSLCEPSELACEERMVRIWRESRENWTPNEGGHQR